jgi:hypothetical protein
MFTSFNIKYPEYEVVTPQTKLSFTLRSLTVQEEEHLKGSFMTPNRIAEHLNKCLYDSIVSKPESITNYDTFLRSITLKDRDVLIYGLFHITYEEIRNYQVKCSGCSKEYPISVEVSKTFNFNQYPGQDILQDKIKVDLPVSKGVSAYIKQPTLFDEAVATKELSGRPGINLDTVTEILIIDRFEQDIEKQVTPLVINDRLDIIEAYLSLPARDKRAIYGAWDDNFGKYGISLKMKSYCQFCGKDELFDIDLVESFFRSLYSAR